MIFAGMQSTLAQRIDSEFLPFVIKPGRYVGNELNSIHKDHAGRVRIALGFPDLYDIGMSHVGSHIIYHIVNGLDYAVAERVFAPGFEAEERLRKIGLPLFSLESRTPLKDFDLLGFTLSYELGYTNILNMIDLAGIPLRHADRSEDDPIVVFGGSCTFNPEPMADFADVMFIGDGEEAIVEIIDVMHNRDGATREEVITRLADIQGVYVPADYEPEYTDNKFAGLKKLNDNAPDLIEARKLDKLKSEYYPSKPIVPFVEITHDRLPIEIMRGCGRGCRFCQAGVIYRPKRERTADEVVKQAKDNIAVTGFSDVTLLSLSSSDHTEIEKIVDRLSKHLQEQRVTLSLPSLRPNGFTDDLAKKISATRRTGLTLAPEAGTDRLRAVMNKAVPEEEFLSAVRVAFENGWNLLKLYFMVGLPTETDDDLDAICTLLKKITRFVQTRPGKKTINVTTSPFCPKPHTPWQWEGQIGHDEIIRRQKHVLINTPRSVNVKYRNPEVTLLESALGRGDRRVGNVIEHAFRNGARLDGWSEYLKYDIWVESFKECGLEIEQYHGEIPYDAPLPWDHISKGLKKDWLQREAMRSKGLVDSDKDTQTEPSRPVQKKSKPKAPAMEYGRRTKRVKPAANMQVPNSRVRVKWGKTPEVRFLSHLDNSRVFERALRRAKIPVAYSQGFHPHQRLAFGPPLTLGFSSEAEYFDIQLDAPYNTEMFDKLNAALPDGFQIYQTKPLLGKGRSLSAIVNLACYRVVLPMDIGEAISKRTEILEMESLITQRKTKTDIVEAEIRPGIIGIEIDEHDGDVVLDMVTGLGTICFARPNEVVQYGFGLPEETVIALPFHRTDLLIHRDDKRLTPFDVH